MPAWRALASAEGVEASGPHWHRKPCAPVGGQWPAAGECGAVARATGREGGREAPTARGCPTPTAGPGPSGTAATGSTREGAAVGIPTGVSRDGSSTQGRKRRAKACPAHTAGPLPGSKGRRRGPGRGQVAGEPLPQLQGGACLSCPPPALPKECAAVVLELKKRPSPRSPSFTTPVAVMKTLAGLMSGRQRRSGGGGRQCQKRGLEPPRAPTPPPCNLPLQLGRAPAQSG